LQLSWLKALLADPRICLFFDENELTALSNALTDIQALFNPDDFYIFDKARDGDCFESEEYRRTFRVFLNAIHNNAAVAVQYEGGKGHRVNSVFWPYKIEYSSKDDKFRALCYRRHGIRKISCILNLGRVVSVHMARVDEGISAEMQEIRPIERFGSVTLEISKERNALERCMIQFAHFEKRTEYDASTDRYTCIIKYNIMDESELVIRVLSFGPTVRVLGPDRFLQVIRQRVEKQTLLMSQ
jgi:predicted DNA-binding transcriptional regulator YafY